MQRSEDVRVKEYGLTSLSPALVLSCPSVLLLLMLLLSAVNMPRVSITPKKNHSKALP